MCGSSKGRKKRRDNNGSYHHLGKVCRNSREGSDPVPIYDDLCEIVTDYLYGRGTQHGEKVKRKGLASLCDPADEKTGGTADDKGERSPDRVRRKKIEECHSYAAGDGADFFAEEDGGDKHGDVPQMNEAAGNAERVHLNHSEEVCEDDEHGTENNGACVRKGRRVPRRGGAGLLPMDRLGHEKTSFVVKNI